MRRPAFFLVLLVLVPVNPPGAEGKAGGLIDFGRIDVPFKANFTISFVLSAERMYVKTDSPRIIVDSQVSGEVGSSVTLNVSLVVPADAKPRRYLLHIYITPGLVGSVEPQVTYLIRFVVKGLDVAAFNPTPKRIFFAIYNSYPEASHVRAKVYMDGSLLSDLEGDAPAEGYATRNVTGDFDGRHNFTVVARSSSGYKTRYEYRGDVLPVSISVNVDVRTNGRGVEVEISLKNLGRDANVIIEARGRSSDRNDSRSQSVFLASGDATNVTITLSLSLPAFVIVRVIAVTERSRYFRISGVAEQARLDIMRYVVYGLSFLAIAAALSRVARRPRGKFKPERLVAEGLSGPIVAIRSKELIYPPGQARTFLEIPDVPEGDGIIMSDKIYAYRNARGLRVFVVGLGDKDKALEKARKARAILAKRGADIVSEIPPDDPTVDELIEAVFA